VNTGAAGVYGPPDTGFPDDGVIARGRLDQAMWLFAELDLERAAEVRAHGQVLNHHDWPAQATEGPVRRVALG
jgi:predicted amidohydrolase